MPTGAFWKRLTHLQQPAPRSLVALVDFMRFSLMKAAHVVMSNGVKQEIRVRSVEKHFQERSAELQIPPLRFASAGMTKGRATAP
jgi:hypothetical protein